VIRRRLARRDCGLLERRRRDAGGACTRFEKAAWLTPSRFLFVQLVGLILELR